MRDLETYKGIPDKVKIGQREYTILVREKDSDPTLMKAFGYTTYGSDFIVLRDCMSIGACRSTLLHEIMHAMMYVADNDFTENIYKQKEEVDMDDMKHYFINALEEPIILMMINNKKLMKFLSGKTK